MRLKYSVVISFAIMAATCATAQSVRIVAREDEAPNLFSGPTLGCFLRTSPVDLRLIWGVPGATYVSSAQSFAIPTTRNSASNAIISSLHDWVLIDQGGEVSASALSACQAVRTTDLHVSGGIDIGASSASGKLAAIYSHSTGVLSVVAGLSNAPEVTTVYSGGGLPLSVLALAISDSSVLAVSSHSGVYVLSAGSGPVLVYPSTDVPSLAFLPGSTDLAIADRAGTQIAILQDVTGARSLQVMATASGNMSPPSMIVSAGRGRVVALAGAELVSFDIARGTSARVAIMAGAERISALPTPGVVMVTATGRPAQIVNFNESNPRGYVVAIPEHQSDSKRVR